MTELPKKILRVKDITFVLPDDFSGTTEDAFEELLNYKIDNSKNGKKIDPNDLVSTYTAIINSNKSRFCGQYAVYELVGDTYIQKEE